MAKTVMFLTLIGLIAISAFWIGVGSSMAGSVEPKVTAQESCIQPTGKAAQACRKLEEHILATTVRIQLQGWSVAKNESGYEIDSKVSHATVRDGRYLVTHNHFSFPLSNQPQNEEAEAYIQVILSKSTGEILFKGPLSDFEIVWEDPETLVFACKDDDLLEQLGIESAEFRDWSSVPLAVGMEVAQVDWDGNTTRVDWTTVQEVNVEDGVPRLVLADAVTLGASGGGIFWHGIHIANNWLLVQHYGESGALTDMFTKAALNSAPVTG